jgi:hypothetical protein
VVTAGFVDFEITWRADVFDGAPQESSAADFGTQGINFRARKALDDEEWATALSALSCDLPSWPALPESQPYARSRPKPAEQEKAIMEVPI